MGTEPEREARKAEPRVTGRGAFLTLLTLFLLSALCGMVIMAALAVINVGGYCAEGGPYVIAQHCPDGSAVVLSLGIPLMFLLGFFYAMAKPAPWPSTFGWLWPVLFVGMAIAFFIGAANAPGGIGWAAIVTGIVMLVLGVAPIVIFAGRSSDSSRAPLSSRFSTPAAIQGSVLVVGVAFGAWAFGAIW